MKLPDWRCEERVERGVTFQEFESEKTVTMYNDPSVKALNNCEESNFPQFTTQKMEPPCLAG